MSKYQSCPCCRSPHVSPVPSKIARKVISEIKVPCQHCETKIESGSMQNHLNQCPKVRIACRLCKIELLQGDVPKHMGTMHQAEARKYLVAQMMEPKSGKIEMKAPPPGDHNYFKVQVNRFNRKATLGTTSKYYCGGKL